MELLYVAGARLRGRQREVVSMFIIQSKNHFRRGNVGFVSFTLRKFRIYALSDATTARSAGALLAHGATPRVS